MAETTTLVMAHMVRRRSARTAILAIIRMRARRTATGDRVTSQMGFSLESVRGGDGDSVTDFAVAASVVVTDSVADSAMVADLVAVDSPVEEDSAAIGAASPIAEDSVVALPAVEIAASQAVEASMGAVDSTEEVVVVSMVAVEVDFMEVAADTAGATGN